MQNRKTIALSIPTGIAAEIGGYAGDGGKIAKMFSKHFDVITHPNVVNGGILSGINNNILYTEGYIFDEFLKGNLNLKKLNEFEENKIGVIFDKAIPKEILNVHINTIYALKEVMGLDIPFFEITEESAGVRFFVKDEISQGVIENEETLLKCAKKLISKGADALAVVCYFGEDADSEEYEKGCGVDPIGGVEGVISHYLSKKLLIPVAHAPAFKTIDILKTLSNPKTASENISSTYLPCVAMGLSKAPKIIKNKSEGIKNKDIEGLILPSCALGGAGTISAIKNGIKILLVKNKTGTQIGCKELELGDIMEYESYEKCLLDMIKD